MNRTLHESQRYNIPSNKYSATEIPKQNIIANFKKLLIITIISLSNNIHSNRNMKINNIKLAVLYPCREQSGITVTFPTKCNLFKLGSGFDGILYLIVRNKTRNDLRVRPASKKIARVRLGDRFNEAAVNALDATYICSFARMLTKQNSVPHHFKQDKSCI